MYSIHNRDDLEKLKKLQETKSFLKAEISKEKLGKQDFHYDMEEVFEPVTENQKKSQNQTKLESEKQTQALRDSTQTTTQAIQDQIRAIQESSNTPNKKIHKSVKEGIQEYDKITNRNNRIVTDLVNSNQVDSSIVKTVSNLLNDNNKSQFSLEPVEGSSNLFTINPTDPQQVLIKGSTMTFPNGNTYYLNDPDLSNFITNTQIDKIPQNTYVIYSFLNDMKYNIYYGDKKSRRYHLIKAIFNTYYQQPQLGTGLNFIFLPSDPDELVDQLKLLYFEKVGGNDNPMLSKQIIAIANKRLQNQCITTNQHQNLISTFTKKDQFVD